MHEAVSLDRENTKRIYQEEMPSFVLKHTVFTRPDIFPLRKYFPDFTFKIDRNTVFIQ